MTAYQFQFSPQSEKEFSSLPTELQGRIIRKLEFWERTKNPLSFAKKLQAEKQLYRFRIGDYRIITTPKSATIFIILVILKIGHRRETYD